jgi:drug/metabolite transporter (DMT)-like permease
MIYSATYGLAGPASAMVQSQCVVHTILAAVFLDDVPRPLDIAGILCAIFGAVVMSVDI